MISINPKVKEILEWVICILIAIVLALAVRFYLGTPTVVESSSMYPTLIEGQRLVLNRLARTNHDTFQRGEIITFEAPSKRDVANNEADLVNPTAKYEKQPQNWWEEFVYYVLEINKVSYIKRVIALPGEHVTIKEGKVYINGEILEEPYLQKGVTTNDGNGHYGYVDLTVPEGTVFVMGDNREKSMDSRSFGCIPISKIESKVCIRFWPLNLFGEVK